MQDSTQPNALPLALSRSYTCAVFSYIDTQMQGSGGHCDLPLWSEGVVSINSVICVRLVNFKLDTHHSSQSIKPVIDVRIVIPVEFSSCCI